jgi:perosamine synthetase
MTKVDKKLAVMGGPRLITKSPLEYRWIGQSDIFHLSKMVKTNLLSGFLAQTNESHFGGQWIRKMEVESARVFGTRYSVALNSWTSGLEAMVQAFRLREGSEIIVPPWTMSATVSAIVNARLVPRFVDIEEDSFNLSPDGVLKAINEKTTGILAVDIFGQPCKAKELRKIADDAHLIFMVDSAQTPRACVDGRHSVQYAHAGGFSLNRHKHIQVGEGGIAVTNSEEIATIMQYLRNHAEVTSVNESKFSSLKLIGHNLRMGEMEALLGLKQLIKLDTHVAKRRNWGRKLKNLILEKKLEGLEITLPESYDAHDFYILPMRLNVEKLCVSRNKIASALRAEGVTGVVSEYGKLNHLPSFADFPTENLEVAEELSEKKFLGIYMCGHRFTEKNLRDIAMAFEKVWHSIDALKH